jgi:hypothetical protein
MRVATIVSRMLPKRYVTVAAALATVVLAVLVPAAGTAAREPDRAALVRELAAAIEDETRALKLLAKSPPRKETAGSCSTARACGWTRSRMP